MNKTYTVSISFEEIKLPPFQDILVLGKNSAQGRIGLARSLELLAPGVFEAVLVERDNVDTIFVNKGILEKISAEKIIHILEANVFPHIYQGDLISVDFKLRFAVNDIIVKNSQP